VRGRLGWAALAAGFAVSIGYAALLLAVPLVILGWGQWRRLALAGATLAGGFLLLSPFVLAHPGRAAHDLWRAARGVTRGAFGYEHDHWAGFAYLGHLWHGLGPVLLVALLGVGLALGQRRQRADSLVPAFAGAAFLTLLLTRAHPETATLVLVPALATLAARVRYLASVTLLLLVVPLTWSVRADVKLTREDTRVAALHWISAHVPAGAALAEDARLPLLPGARVTQLRLPPDDRRSVTLLRVEGIRYVLVDGAVADKVRAARDRDPAEARFYADLARRKPLVRFAEDRRHSGPWVALYRL
jgi:hypothetical protein